MKISDKEVTVESSPLENSAREPELDEDFKFQSYSGESEGLKKIKTFIRKIRRSTYYKKTCSAWEWAKKSSIVWTILMLPLIIIADVLYISSDQPCPFKSNTDCLLAYANQKVAWWIEKVTMCAGILCSLVLLSFFFKKLPKAVGFIALANIIYFGFFYDNRLTFQYYGQAFAIFLLFLVINFFIAFFILYAIVRCFKKKPVPTGIFVVFMFLILPVIIYFKSARPSCNHWAVGLDGERIDNSYGCQIRLPTTCLYDMVDGMFSFSFSDCSGSKILSERNKLYPASPIVALPRAENAPKDVRAVGFYQTYILKNTIGVDSFDDEKVKDREIFVDQRDHNDVKMVINVKRNETLVKERAKIKSEGISKNMLVVFVDSISRARLFKKLTKTLSWFESHMNKRTPEMETFQFFKFHAITGFTDGNIMAAYWGLNFTKGEKGQETPVLGPKPEHPKSSFAKYWKENGYILGAASDICGVSNLPRHPKYKDYMEITPFDHEGSPMACDPNYYDINNYYSIFSGYSSFTRRCIYGHDMNNFVFEYGKQFWKAYKDEKKLLWLDMLDAHEGTQEVIKFMDEPLFNLLNGLEKDNLLQDTTIMFWSDHGLHYDIFPINLQQFNFRQERGLPFLFFVFPQSVTKDYRENIKENQQKLLSGFQVYDLLMAFPTGKKSPYFKKTLLNPLPFLTCDELPIAKVSHHMCYCNYPDNFNKGKSNKKFRALPSYEEDKSHF